MTAKSPISFLPLATLSATVMNSSQLAKRSNMAIAEQIKIVEVGPRDGLQNESTVSVEAKVTLIEL